MAKIKRKKFYSSRVLWDYLENQPPHLALIRSFEAVLYERYLPFSGQILDIGCGDGFFSQTVFKKQKIDLGLEMKGSLWKEAVKRGNYKKIELFNGKKIPCPDSSFDTIVSNCVLEHVNDFPVLLAEICRVLKKKGSFFCTVVTDHFGENLLGTRVLGKRYKDWFNKKSIHVCNTSSRNWRGRFEKAGFKVERMRKYMTDPGINAWFDISHYWGIVNLLEKKLFNDWTWGLGKITNVLWGKLFLTLFRKEEISTKKSPYLFFELKKEG